MQFDPIGDYSAGGSTEVLAHAVAQCDAFFDERPDGRGKSATLHVLQYRLARRLLTDPELTANRPEPDFAHLTEASRRTQILLRSFTLKWPLLSDGEYHALLRRHLEGTIRPLATHLTTRAQSRVRAALRHGNGLSWRRQVADRIATDIVAALLGVTEGTAHEIVSHAATITDQFSTLAIDEERARRAIGGLEALESWLVDQVSGVPRTDFMRALRAVHDDERLGIRAASAALAQAVTGAYDPVVSTLCTLATRFTPHGVAGMSTATIVEEIIRVASPFRFTVRYNRNPLQLGELSIPPETRCVLGLASSNLDPEHFPDPLTLHPRTAAHMAFGVGRHYCLGAAAARAVVRGVIDALHGEGARFVPDQVSYGPDLGLLRYFELDGHWAAA
jgi:cytochrome P450